MSVARKVGSSEAAELPNPIDHAHLARYTLGNRPLELEVLQLFVGQAPAMLADLRSASNPRSWHNAAHTLKGSARAIGAWRLARTAEEAERNGPRTDVRCELIAGVEAAIAEVCAYVATLPVTA
jgi:HPt (histidine-containing phosphotransfer) domain-containing protein